MRQAAIILVLAVASMAGSFLESVIDSLGWPALTGIALTIFSGFLVFTIMTAQSPIKWNPIRISPDVAEHAMNVLTLIGVLIIFFVAAVILVAIAGTGPDQSFLESLLYLIKCLMILVDV
ncbi:hypothetical protein DYBT9623_04443 [Dyadobacter sp. CECT 9623]|uniref:Uncharacterized protein n=1 Tax=Dyadobacter linearis TaxID=2823330 RepID=A0ABM8UVR4_9BACT|nr:hypothetical protein [Dyadobacter sp. CECT 9623]CAG5072906.1 hypothetical protein DYBT9623_04443 [Dyadobacter sp. CECT 9623]